MTTATEILDKPCFTDLGTLFLVELKNNKQNKTYYFQQQDTKIGLSMIVIVRMHVNSACTLQ